MVLQAVMQVLDCRIVIFHTKNLPEMEAPRSHNSAVSQALRSRLAVFSILQSITTALKASIIKKTISLC